MFQVHEEETTMRTFHVNQTDKTYFLSPVGGAVTTTPKRNADVFRSGLVANVKFDPEVTTTSSLRANNTLPQKCY